VKRDNLEEETNQTRSIITDTHKFLNDLSAAEGLSTRINDLKNQGNTFLEKSRILEKELVKIKQKAEYEGENERDIQEYRQIEDELNNLRTQNSSFFTEVFDLVTKGFPEMVVYCIPNQFEKNELVVQRTLKAYTVSNQH
jgi:hypothetical protein